MSTGSRNQTFLETAGQMSELSACYLGKNADRAGVAECLEPVRALIRSALNSPGSMNLSIRISAVAATCAVVKKPSMLLARVADPSRQQCGHTGLSTIVQPAVNTNGADARCSADDSGRADLLKVAYASRF
jgi:hypothetical protein